MPESLASEDAGPAETRELICSGDAVGVAAGLVLDRPPRLGPVRLVAVDGPSGSGKTVFAARLASEIRALLGRSGRSSDGVATLSTDLLATWDDPFGWWPRVEAGVLDPLFRAQPGALRANDWSTGIPRPGNIVDIPVPAVLILEGVSSGRRVVADRLSALIWVEVSDPLLRLERALARDGSWLRPEFLAWQLAENGFFSADQARSRADLRLVSTGQQNDPTTAQLFPKRDREL